MTLMAHLVGATAARRKSTRAMVAACHWPSYITSSPSLCIHIRVQGGLVHEWTDQSSAVLASRCHGGHWLLGCRIGQGRLERGLKGRATQYCLHRRRR